VTVEHNPNTTTKDNSTKEESFETWDGTETGQEIKILLLGSGECGKSTLYRQISNILSQLKALQVKAFIPSIYENIWKMSHQIILSCKKRNASKPFEYEDTKSAAELLLHFEKEFSEFKDDCGYTYNHYQAILTLWKDPKVYEIFQKYRGIDFHVNDGADYLFRRDNLERFKPKPDFMPNFEDIIQCRKKTTGINKLKFKVGQKEFIITDVGGQRMERKKWPNAFEHISVLIFVASLGDFDQMCYEDDITNRMKEAIELFEKTINNELFVNQKILLLLNKKDVLTEKLKKKDLKECFEDFEGGNDYDKCTQFITTKFIENNKGDQKRITTKIVQATDGKSVNEVFEKIKSMLAQKFK